VAQVVEHLLCKSEALSSNEFKPQSHQERKKNVVLMSEQIGNFNRGNATLKKKKLLLKVHNFF
jgi:hypothetical protein